METFLFIVVGILALVAIAQAVRVFELSAEIRGGDESQVTTKDNNIHGILMVAFLIFMLGSFAWMMIEYNDVLLPQSASKHGSEVDNLMFISMAIIIVAGLLTQPLLFLFAYIFRGDGKRQASYMEHNNKLELFWTAVPAVILAGLILYGLATWSSVMNPQVKEEPMVVEIYGKQFSWTARYSGQDNKLGYANVGMIKGTNTLGVDADDPKALDDVITKELHLPADKPVLLKFRAQDVIHSAYLPHFRVQMNCVPGTQTQFQFTPTVTTKEMRQSPSGKQKVASVNEARREAGKDDDYKFDYVLLCNKICGSAHYNMQMKVVVETREEFEQWMSEQKSFAENL